MTPTKTTLPNIAGYLNGVELSKIFVQAHVAALGIALVIGLLTKLSGSVAVMFPNPVVAFLVAQIVGLLIGALRRLPDYDANILPNLWGMVAPTTVATVAPAAGRAVTPVVPVVPATSVLPPVPPSAR